MFFIEELKEYDLILASRSPRRRQLLADCGLEFSLAGDYEVVEEYPRDLPVDEVAAFLSRLKSEAYPEPLGGKDILITADTVVIADGRILGKPAGRETALDMLRSLSGRSHSVITGVTLRNGSRSRTSIPGQRFFLNNCPTKRSTITSTATVRMTRRALTAFRNGSVMWRSSGSKVRFTM